MYGSTNQKGDAAEAAFLFEALSRGYAVCKPFGAAEGYDFIVDNGKTLIRVQVKSANLHKHSITHDKFKYMYGDGKKPLNVNKYDVLACYNFQSKTFYLIPFESITTTTISMGEHKSKYDTFKNNWNVLNATVNEVPYSDKLVDTDDDFTPF